MDGLYIIWFRLASKPDIRPDATAPEPDLVLPAPDPDAHVRHRVQLQIAAQSLLHGLVAHPVKGPVHGEAWRGGGAGRDLEGEVVEDSADGEGMVVVGRCVDGGDVESCVREGGEEG